jgi:hypothetical protein
MADCITTWPSGVIRCADHHDRNPCAVEGCHRTTPAPVGDDDHPRLHDDQHICAQHWRQYVPPRSRARRAYLTFFRQAKRHGWGWKGPKGGSARLDWRFRRFWDQLVIMVRRRSSAGHIDKAAIDKLMGWD